MAIYSPTSQCDGKRRYLKHGAKRAIARMPAHGGMKPYHCTHCGWWHIGHVPPSRRR